MRRWLTLFFALAALAPLCFVLVAGRPGTRPRAPREARVVESGAAPLLRSEDGVEIRLERAPGRLVPATAAAVDLVTQLVPPARVAALPAAAFSFSRLALEPGGWEGLARFEGYGGETLLALRPDLVIAAAWQSPETNAALRRAGVPVLVLAGPERWQDVQDDLRLVAVALCAEEEGRALAAALAARVDALPRRFAGLRALSYTNLGTGGWAAGRGTTADIVFELLGMRNAAADAGLAGHRELDLERLVALDPQVIVVGAPDEREGIASTLAYLDAQPVLAGVAALRDDLVVSLPQELFTTASTELVRAAERLAQELGSRPGAPR